MVATDTEQCLEGYSKRTVKIGMFGSVCFDETDRY